MIIPKVIIFFKYIANLCQNSQIKKYNHTIKYKLSEINFKQVEILVVTTTKLDKSSISSFE